MDDRIQPVKPQRPVRRKKTQPEGVERVAAEFHAVTGQAADLSQRAEMKARSDEAKTQEPLSPEAAGQMLHELQVHQIQLEMQNEELRRAQAELEASRQRYFDLYDMAPVGYFTLSETGLILEANLTAAALLGVTRDALVKQPLTRYIFPADQDTYYQYRKHLFEMGLPQVCQMRMLRANANPFWMRLEATVTRSADGTVHGRAVMSEITDQKRADETLRQEIQKTSDIINAIPSGLFIYQFEEPDRLILERANPEAALLTGIATGDWLGKEFNEIWPNAKAAGIANPYLDAIRTGTLIELDDVVYKDDRVDGVFRIRVFPIPGRKLGVAFENVTQIKRAEHERETSLSLMRLINSANNTHELIHLVTDFIQQWSGFEAVGVRLKDGDDYPYYETRGFSKEFLELENSLCARDLEGQLVRDSVGNPVIECMCGNILCGRFDPKKPFFTEKGSFWSNCTTDLLASTPEADRQSRTRNRCNGEGYESVGLIPLRFAGTTYGLLQLNDRHKGQFTPKLIDLLERLADSVTTALAQRQAQEALNKSRALNQAILDSLSDHIAVLDPEGTILATNAAWRRFARDNGLENLDGIAEGTSYLEVCRKAIQDGVEQAWEILGGVEQVLAGTLDSYCAEYSCHSPNEQRWFEMRVTCLKNNNGGGVVISHHNITDRKRSEEALRENENSLEAIIKASPESAFLIDTDGIILRCNPVSSARLGLRPEEIQGRCIYNFIPPELVASRRQYVERVICSGESHVFEDVRLGRFFRHHLYPVLDHHGKVYRVAIFGDDITEFRNIEKNLQQQKDLLAAIRHAQELFISGHEPRQVYQDMLHILVQATDSAYGFLDEVSRDPDGTPYKLSLALSDISWDDASHHLYDQLVEQKLEFRKLDNLAGAPVIEGRIIIANEVPKHPHSKGIPSGHPPINSFMGIPLYYGDELIGVAAVANRPGGYTEETAESIKPLTQACAAMIWANRLGRRERDNLLALTQSREQLRLTVNAANVGLWDWNLVTNQVYFSPEWKSQIGYQDDEIGHDYAEWQSRIHPDDLDQTIRQTQGFIQKPWPNYQLEFRFRHKDGTYRWILARASLLSGSDGKPVRMLGSHIDITERKKAEEAMRSSEERFRALTTLAPAGIYLTDTGGQCLYANPRWCEMAGLSEEESLGGGWISGLHPDDRERVFLQWERMVKSEGQWGQEYRFRKPDGTTTWVHGFATPQRDASGLICGYVGINLDITDRKRAEEVLRTSEADLNRAQAVAHLGNWGWDIQNDVVSWSGEMYRIYGVNPETFGHTVNDVANLIHPDDLPRQVQAIETLLQGRTFAPFEYRVLRPDGGLRWVQVSFAEVERNASGQLIRMLGTAQDITDRKQAEEKLVEYQAQLRSLLARISIAEEEERKRIAEHLHDSLGQSMVLAKMKLDTLGRSALPPAAGIVIREIGKTVGDLIHTTQSITYDLSNPVLYERGLVAAIQEWIQEEYTPNYAVRVSFRNATRKLELPPEQLAFVYRAVRELLVNVAKHAQTSLATMTIQRRHGRVRITILDDGVGFDPDKPLNRSKSDNHYGLFSIRERLDYLGGTMTIESHSGQGTCVTLILPEPSTLNTERHP